MSFHFRGVNRKTGTWNESEFVTFNSHVPPLGLDRPSRLSELLTAPD